MTTPDPVGYAEIAERLGAQVNTVRSWVYGNAGGDFPEPVVPGRRGVPPVYEWDDVVAWLSRHGRSMETGKPLERWSTRPVRRRVEGDGG